MCKCGCQEWCSQFPLMTLLPWSLKAMAVGCGGQLDISRQMCLKACAGESILLVAFDSTVLDYPTEVPGLPPKWFQLGAQRPAACVAGWRELRRSCTSKATAQSTVERWASPPGPQGFGRAFSAVPPLTRGSRLMAWTHGGSRST